MTKFELVLETTGNEKSARLEAALINAVVEAVLTLGIKTAGAEVKVASLTKIEAPAEAPKA